MNTPSEPTPRVPDPLERPSVLRLLQEQATSRLDLRLHDAAEERDVPVLAGTEGCTLRDAAGRYQVLGEIGRGGVGIVYKGRDQDLGRDVAMKVLRPEHAARPKILERFIEEAQIGGQLQHPGIVPVYELGLEQEERPYFAMKLVKGETLAAMLARRADPSADRRQLLGIFEQICQTIAYAHARGVVHRDLKPMNVMLGSFGEVQVVDWGFAKVLQKHRRKNKDAAVHSRSSDVASVISTVRSDPERGSDSVAGSMCGTPAYMPPEQALGDVEHMDRRSDVFGLGAILCEILTGAPPYLEQNGDLVQQAARADLGTAYERIERSGADRALVALCKQCLAPARQARPESAKQVAAAVSAYLSSVEERARQAQILAAEAKVRARATLLLSLAALLLIALGGGGYLYLQRDARLRRDQANQRVAVALDEAKRRLGEAQAVGFAELAPWTRARGVAAQADRLAQDPDVATEQRSAAGSLLAIVDDQQERASAELSRTNKDEVMRRSLLKARIPTDDNVAGKTYVSRELRRRNDAYAEAFRRYLDERDLTKMSPQAGVALLAGPLAVELAAALDHWVFGRLDLSPAPPSDRTADEATARLRAMANALDPDPWRSRLRSACAERQRDREVLLRLQAEGDLSSLSVESLILLASALENANALEEARAVCGIACERYPGDFGCALALGRLHEIAQEWQPAFDAFTIAHALRPEIVEVRHRLGIVAERLGDFAEAERLFEDLAHEQSATGHWCWHVGKALHAQDALDGAIASFRRAIELDFHSAHNNLGLALEAQGLLDEAAACFRRAIEIDPADAEAYNNLGFTLGKQGQDDAAIDCLRQAIELDSELAAAHGNLGTALRTRNAPEESLAALRRAIELDPSLSRAYVNLGLVLTEQGHLEEAVAMCRRATELEPSSAAAHGNLGNALGKLGRRDEAILSFRRAIELDPRFATALSNLGSFLTDWNRTAEAMEYLERARDLDPQKAAIHIHLGRAHERLGDHAAAIASFLRARELQPASALPDYNLGLCFERILRFDDAVSSFRRAIELDPQHATAHADLGDVLVQQGRRDEAISCYERAVELDPEDPAHHFSLGGGRELQGRPDEALACLRRAESIWSRRSDTLSKSELMRVAPILERVEREAARMPELLALARGERESQDGAELIEAAILVARRDEFVASMRTFARAFDADPELLAVPPHRYLAARAAALSGSAQGSGVAALTEAERAALLEQAREWLAQEIERWHADLELGGEERDQARKQLEFTWRDSAFDGVRGAAALQALDASASEGWRALWSEVAAVLETLTRGK